MNEITKAIIDNLYVNIDRFENYIDEQLEKYDEETKKEFLSFVKKILKEEKKEIVLEKNECQDEVKEYELKNKSKKIKKKIFLINYKLRQLNKVNSSVKTTTGGLNNNQKMLGKAMLEGKDIETNNVADLIVAYNYIINNEKLIDEELIYKYSHEINNQLSDYMAIYNKIFPELLMLLNTLKNKISNNDKDSSERKVYKKVLKDFKNTYDIYKPNNDKEKVSPYFEIMMRWIQDEDKYYYIKELIKRKPGICNLRYEDRHIIFYILDCYIINLKKLINDKNSNYINDKYLREVYFLITKNPALRIKKEEKAELDNTLNELKIYIEDTLIKQKRKNYVKNQIDEMKSNKFYKNYSYYNFENFTEDNFNYMYHSLSTYIKGIMNNKQGTDAFVLGNQAYKISSDGNTIVLDLYEILYIYYVSSDSMLNRYLQRCEMNHEKVDEELKYQLSFKNGCTYPVIDYRLEFYPSGKFKNLTVHKDVVSIKKEFKQIKDDEDLNELYSLYKKSVIKNNGIYSDYDIYKLNSHFEDILQGAYIDFLKKEKLPFIYYGRVLPIPKEVERNLTDLNNILYDLDKANAAEVVDILSNKIDSYHYSNLEIPNGEYKLNLLNPISYLGMENEKMLTNCYFNERLLNDKRLHSLKLEFMDNYIKEVQMLNSNLDYVDPNLLKYSRGKIKNRIRL